MQVYGEVSKETENLFQQTFCAWHLEDAVACFGLGLTCEFSIGGHIAIPSVNTNYYRALDKSEYWLFPKVSRSLYGLRQFVKNQDYCVLVEGHRDVWALHINNIPAFALQGLFLSDLQIEQLEPFKDKTLIVAMDNDFMGQKASKFNLQKLQEQGFNALEHRDWHGAKDAAELWTRQPKSLKNVF